MTDLPQQLLHCGYQVPGPNKFARPKSGYTADQMREYGELCRKMALEEAAEICDDISTQHNDTYKHKPGPNAYDPHFQGLSMGAGERVAARCGASVPSVELNRIFTGERHEHTRRSRLDD